jgi:hypothetical protein
MAAAWRALTGASGRSPTSPGPLRAPEDVSPLDAEIAAKPRDQVVRLGPVLNREFEKQSTETTKTCLYACKEYEDPAQTALHPAITHHIPDEMPQPIDLFVDRPIAIDLSPFIAKAQDWNGQLFSDWMPTLGLYEDKPYRLPFEVATPLIDFNEYLAAKTGAGLNNFRQIWDELFALSNKISKLGNDTKALLHSWTISGTWMWQELAFYGSQMTSDHEKKVAFDREPDMPREGGMPDLRPEGARLSRPSGPVPIGLDSRTALYDIEAHTVYMPNGDRLEAHSGLGNRFDDPRYVHERNRGATPPHVYDLELRRGLFHGVAALRLKPVGAGNMFGRVGMLAHSYMLGPHGESNGCVVFKDYPRFLQAFRSGGVSRLLVVTHLAAAPPIPSVASTRN